MKTLILIIAIICTQLTNIIGQTVNADFNADLTEGCNSIVVSFTNNSLPSEGLLYNWDFGNGTNSSLKDPTVAYTQSGLYSVKLTVTDGSETHTLIKDDYITVYNGPEVNIGIFGDEAGCAPHQIQFNDNSIPGDGIVSEWNWDFGDGSISQEQNPIHDFVYQSDFSISLVAKDENNCTGIGTYNNLISVFKPTASFIANPLNSCFSEIDVNFYNNSNGIGNQIYKWDFGDGTSSEEQQPTHIYNTNGNYSVKLVVFDEQMCSDTLMKEDYITLSGVNAEFSVNENTLCPNEDVEITNSTTGAISYLWDFGDGTFSELQTPNHSYSTPGNYTISLTANHQFGCTDMHSININVENVVADFNFSDDFACELPAIVNYTNNSINGETYEWHFGEDMVSNEKNPIITFEEKGIYNISLKVTSTHGCVATKMVESCMTIMIPRAYFTPNIWVDEYDIKGCAPLTINFENKSNYETEFDNIEGYYWTYGDGTNETEESPTHIYTDIGKYLVQFYFVTSEGCTSIPYSAEAKVGTPQVTNFYKTLADTICASQEIQFFDSSQDSTLIDEWFWLFGDTEYSKKQNPTHIYTDTGYMEVLLQSYYNGCPSIEVKKDFIYINGPIVDINYEIKCENPYEVFLNSNAIDADKLVWDFGDDSPLETSINTIHLFKENKSYTVNLTSINSGNNCSFSSTKEIFIKDIKANYTITKTEGCENLSVMLNSENSEDDFHFYNENTYGKYFWDFGDGETLMTNSVEVKHVYKNKGIYPLKLLVKDFRGCEDTLITDIQIYKPDVDLSTLDQEGCIPMEVDFNNLTNSDTTISKWTWNFGDGIFSNKENPIHTYNNFGIYNVSLTATDALGCVGTIFKNKYIQVLKPIPNFITDDNTICLGDTINFTPVDTSRIVSYYWDFGDGGFSTELNPNHIYNNTGYFPVTLTLVDSQGCDSTQTINDYVYIQDIPSPNFSSSDASSDCYPLHVNFSDTINNPDVIDWYWSFGDGETSSHLRNPIHIYTAPGLYDVELNVTTGNGCVGQILKQNYIDIKGPYAEMNVVDTLCKNNEALFFVKDKQDVFELQWIFGDGNTSSQDTVSHSYEDVGYMHPVLLLKSDNLGTCDIYLSDSIYIPQLLPTINSTDDIFSNCVPFEFNPYNNCIDANNWQWDFGDGFFSNISNPTHTYLSPGIRNVKLTISNNFGCVDSSNIFVKTFALPIITSNDTLICHGDEITLRANGAENYEWFPKKYLDDEDANEPISKPNNTITYTVFGTDINGCINNSELKIFVQQEPVVNINDTAVIIGENVILNAYSDDILTYSWFPNYEITCNDCPEITVNPLEPTTYEITVTDINKCFTKTYNIFVDILKKYTIDVPSAFTPNGDGINDKIFVRGWGMEDLILFQIFNRYGEIVFHTSDKNIGWDGTYKGKMQGTETYTYLANVRTYENEILSKRGTIKLLK